MPILVFPGFLEGRANVQPPGKCLHNHVNVLQRRFSDGFYVVECLSCGPDINHNPIADGAISRQHWEKKQ